MNKIIGSFLLAAGVLCLMGRPSEASNIRGAKGYNAINYSTTGSSVAVSGPAVVYSVLVSTGTAGTDYVALFDQASLGGTVATTMTNLKTRIYVSSTTQNTYIVFDPPIQFNLGIIAANSAVGLQTLITYERGRVNQGY